MNKLNLLVLIVATLLAVGCNESATKSVKSDKNSLFSKREQVPNLNGTSLSVDKTLNMKPAGNSRVGGINKPSEQSTW